MEKQKETERITGDNTMEVVANATYKGAKMLLHTNGMSKAEKYSMVGLMFVLLIMSMALVVYMVQIFFGQFNEFTRDIDSAKTVVIQNTDENKKTQKAVKRNGESLYRIRKTAQDLIRELMNNQNIVLKNRRIVVDKQDIANTKIEKILYKLESIEKRIENLEKRKND